MIEPAKQINATINLMTEKSVREFEHIRTHLEQCHYEDFTEEDVIQTLVNIGMANYKFL